VPRAPLRATALLAAALLLPGALPAAAAPQAAPEKEEVSHDIVSFDPFPRRAPAGETVRISFRLKNGAVVPVLVVVFPDGDAAYLHAETRSGSHYVIPFRLDPRGGTHRVALVVRVPTGDRRAGQFKVEALDAAGKEVDRDLDLPPETTPYPALDQEEDPIRLERILFHRMNGLRRKQGLAVLPWHEGVARAARELLPSFARHWEETRDPRTGIGRMPHEVPGAGKNGGKGPTIAARAASLLGWSAVLAHLPPDPPRPAKDAVQYVSESLTFPDSSLDRKFEQSFLRVSAFRAPMLSPHLTHAAGAATWRWYGWKAPADGSRPPEEPPPAPPGAPREAFGALVFVQVNDPRAEAAAAAEGRAALRAAADGDRKPADRAAALRALGRVAPPAAPKALAEAFARARDPVVAAGALDGLWLCAPEEARALAEPLRVGAVAALDAEEEGRAARGLTILAGARHDAASRKAGAAALAEVERRGEAALRSARAALLEGRREDARALYAAAEKRFDGFPAALDAREALRLLGPAPPGGPPPSPPPAGR
jgi:hypothetical protein